MLSDTVRRARRGNGRDAPTASVADVGRELDVDRIQPGGSEDAKQSGECDAGGFHGAILRRTSGPMVQIPRPSHRAYRTRRGTAWRLAAGGCYAHPQAGSPRVERPAKQPNENTLGGGLLAVQSMMSTQPKTRLRQVWYPLSGRQIRAAAFR